MSDSPISHLASGIDLIAEDGRKITVVPDYFQAMTVSDIEKTIGGVSNVLKLRGQTSNVILDGEINDQQRTFSMDIEFNEPAKLYTLVPGGWLPPAFVTPASFLVDRNVISNLSKLGYSKGGCEINNTHYWLDFHKSKNIAINPMLYAMEGDARTTPSYDEFRASYEDAIVRIKEQLPNASVIIFNQNNFDAGYALVVEYANRLPSESKLLIDAMPMLVNRSSDNDLTKNLHELIIFIRRNGVNPNSLVIQAILSCLFENKFGIGILIGRKILKPKSIYTAEDAYNALMDIRSLELYILFSNQITTEFKLCTADQAIAAFWCALMLSNVTPKCNGIQFTVELSEQLFPRMSDEHFKLLNTQLLN